jgi:hypothetical protein
MGFVPLSPSSARSLLAVFLGVQLRGFLVMLRGVQLMPMRHLGMVRGLFVIAGLMVLGGFAMVLGRMLVVQRRLLVMLVNVVFVEIFAVHRSLPGLLRCKDGTLPRPMKHLRPAFVSLRRAAMAGGELPQFLSQ